MITFGALMNKNLKLRSSRPLCKDLLKKTILLCLILALSWYFFHALSFHAFNGNVLSLQESQDHQISLQAEAVNSDQASKVANKFFSITPEKGALKSFLSSIVSNVQFTDSRINKLHEIGALDLSIKDSNLAKLISDNVVDVAINEAELKKYLLSISQYAKVDKSKLLGYLTDFAYNNTLEFTTGVWKVVKGNQRLPYFDGEPQACDGFYANKQKIRAIFPLFWFGSSLPEYVYNFFHSVNNNSLFDVLLINIDVDNNECKFLDLRDGELKSENLIFSCVAPAAFFADVTSALCEGWDCSEADEKLVFQLISQRMLAYPYAWVEFKPLIMHFLQRHISNCYTHWIIGDADTFHGSYEHFPVEFVENFDVVTVGNIFETVLYWRGQFTILSRSAQVVQLYKSMPEYASLYSFLKRFVLFIENGHIAHYSESIAEGSIARAAYSNRDISIASVYGQANILYANVYVLAQEASGKKFILEVDKERLEEASAIVELPEPKPISLETLMKNGMHEALVLGSPCEDLWWVEDSGKQCVLSEQKPRMPVLMRPSPLLADSFGIEYRNNSIIVADISSYSSVANFSGIQTPYFIHFRELKQKEYNVDFSNWVSKNESRNIMFYLYHVDTPDETGAFKTGILNYDSSPFSELAKLELS